MAHIAYSDHERAEFLELAKEIGITRTMRELGYPKHWATGKSWADNAGIGIPLDTIKAQAAAHHDWYKAEDLLIVAKEALLRIIESLQTDKLTADEQKKLAEAYQKYVNTILLLEGKATNISETRKTDTMDLAINELLTAEAARNTLIEQGEDVTSE